MTYDATITAEPVRGLIDLRGDAEAATAFADVLGFALPAAAGATSGDGGRSAFWLGPDEWLVVAAAAEESELHGRLDGAIGPRHAAATLVSDAYAVFRIAGPDATAILAQATGVDLHPAAFGIGRCVRAGFAKTTAIVHRVADTAYDIYVEASFRRYLALWLAAARGQ